MNGMFHSSQNKWQKPTSMHTHTIHKNDWYTISIAACINYAVPPILARGACYWRLQVTRIREVKWSVVWGWKEARHKRERHRQLWVCGESGESELALINVMTGRWKTDFRPSLSIFVVYFKVIFLTFRASYPNTASALSVVHIVSDASNIEILGLDLIALRLFICNLLVSVLSCVGWGFENLRFKVQEIPSDIQRIIHSFRTYF
jgi:hypothetical protein